MTGRIHFDVVRRPTGSRNQLCSWNRCAVRRQQRVARCIRPVFGRFKTVGGMGRCRMIGIPETIRVAGLRHGIHSTTVQRAAWHP